jgi:flavin reductase (DIM6/NTAB) family NADH-FMN oxidoreductase RutF
MKKALLLDEDLFRTVMGNFPAGVTVVTAIGSDGDPRGCTVSAFCSVSLTPPLLLVCIDNNSNTLPAIKHSGGFTVNFLRSDGCELATRFAAKQPDKFDSVPWRPAPTSEGGPILEEGCCAYSVCRVTEALPAGDHWIFVGAMEAGEIWHDRAPLLYCRSTFSAWSPQLAGLGSS